MTPTIAIIFALAIAAWALVWWDIERRKTRDYTDRLKDDVAMAALRGSVTGMGERIGHLTDRIEKLERHPATMSATKERMDTLEKAWANFRDQAVTELEQMRARTMTLTNVKATRFGARPNG